ncbi:hypothetical protein [uncultured Tessaracoccus sp.]|uniref:hypothetical protein n=1 Tax=uncultured Tessaracoccus sp. TaxID=905023 RepID=UPI0025DEBD6F|nr:hypothetical protein [uncultured Tessaracoccus sp.]
MDTWLHGLVVAVCGALAVAGNPVVRALLTRIDPPRPASDPTVIDAQPRLPGGRWIGLLERAATYVCLVAGFPEGLAFILVVKGLGRYPELRNGQDPRLGELFIIGTFASLLWAAAFAGIAVGVNRQW